jgi:hypothetical protein
MLSECTHKIWNQKEENFLKGLTRLIFFFKGLADLCYVTVHIRYEIKNKSIFWKGRHPNHLHSADKWRQIQQHTRIYIYTYIYIYIYIYASRLQNYKAEGPVFMNPAPWTTLRGRSRSAQCQYQYRPVFKCICSHQLSCWRQTLLKWGQEIFQSISDAKVTWWPANLYRLSYLTRLK